MRRARRSHVVARRVPKYSSFVLMPLAPRAACNPLPARFWGVLPLRFYVSLTWGLIGAVSAAALTIGVVCASRNAAIPPSPAPRALSDGADGSDFSAVNWKDFRHGGGADCAPHTAAQARGCPLWRVGLSSQTPTAGRRSAGRERAEPTPISGMLMSGGVDADGLSFCPSPAAKCGQQPPSSNLLRLATASK